MRVALEAPCVWTSLIGNGTGPCVCSSRHTVLSNRRRPAHPSPLSVLLLFSSWRDATSMVQSGAQKFEFPQIPFSVKMGPLERATRCSLFIFCFPFFLPDYPVGGSGAIVEALVRGLRKHGGTLRLGTHVEQARSSHKMFDISLCIHLQ